MGYDATNKESFGEIKNYWYNQVKELSKTNLIYLLENKIDLLKGSVTNNDGKQFADLNKIKFFSLSVKKDININNFIDDLRLNLLNNVQSDMNNINNGIKEIIYGNPSKETYTLVLLGDMGISKTCFFDRLISNTFNEYTYETKTPYCDKKVIHLKNRKELTLEIWDTSGIEKFADLDIFFAKKADIIILGYDITRKTTFENVKRLWYPKSKKFQRMN